MPRFWRKKSKPIADRSQPSTTRSSRIPDHQTDQRGRCALAETVETRREVSARKLQVRRSAYRGGNTLNLASVAIERGYSDHRWGTYKQIKAAGGYMSGRGEKGTRLSSYVDYTPHGSPVKDDRGSARQGQRRKTGLRQRCTTQHTITWKRYVVFNVEQAERLNLPERPQAKPGWEAHDAAERVIRASGVDFRHERGDRAFYQLDKDRVVMPPREQFGDAGRYYRTALHEVAHATGHPDRMDRQSLQDAVKAGPWLSELRPRGAPGRDQLHDDQHRTRHRP